jgi:Cu-Zn family superoxide dismutase
MRRTQWRRLLTSVLALALVGAGAAVAKEGKGQEKSKGKDRGVSLRVSSISLPGATVFPEGIAAAGAYIYTGSSGQGTIFRAPRRGSAAEILSPGGTDGRTAAIGMKADRKGNLIVAGGGTGKVFVLDRATGATLGIYSRPAGGVYAPSTPTFLNDVVITKNGDAYITDSFSAVLYRIPAASLAAPSTTGTLEEWLAGPALAPIAYQNGFNLNGIVADKNRYLLVVQANTGKLYRVTISTKAVQEVTVTGTTLTGGDGMVLENKNRLSVVHEGKVDVLKLSRNLRRAKLRATITSSTFDSPTTAAIHKGRLYVVNSQFGKRATGTPPALPFTISVIKPGRGKR